MFFLSMIPSNVIAQPPLIFADAFESGNTERWGNPSPTPCDALGLEGLGQSYLEGVIATVIDDLETDQPWREEFFWSIFSDVAAEIGCEIPAASQNSLIGAADCQAEYCGEVAYCGPGDSQTNALTAGFGLPSQWLNKICFQHDRCYDSFCVDSVGCIWSLQKGIRDCDSAFFSDYASEPGSPTLYDFLIKALASAFKKIHEISEISLELCGTTEPCGNGSICWPQAGGGTCVDLSDRSCDLGTECQAGEQCFWKEGAARCVEGPPSSEAKCWFCRASSTPPVPPRYHTGALCGINPDRTLALIRQRSCPFGCGTGNDCLCIPCSDVTGFQIQSYDPDP